MKSGFSLLLPATMQEQVLLGDAGVGIRELVRSASEPKWRARAAE